MGIPYPKEQTKEVLSWLDYQAGTESRQGYLSTLVSSAIAANVSFDWESIDKSNTSTGELNNLFLCYKNYCTQKKKEHIDPTSEIEAAEFLDWLAQNKHVKALQTLEKLGAQPSDIQPRLTLYPAIQEFNFKNTDEFNTFLTLFGKDFDAKSGPKYVSVDAVMKALENIADRTTQQRMAQIVLENAAISGKDDLLRTLLSSTILSQELKKQSIDNMFEKIMPHQIRSLLIALPNNFDLAFNTNFLFKVLKHLKNEKDKQYLPYSLINHCLARGIDFTLKDENGKSPWEVAKENGFERLAILKKKLDHQSNFEAFYQERLENISKMIILGSESKPYVFINKEAISAFTSNYKGYLDKNKETQHGAELTLTIDGVKYPIGYTVYIPPQVQGKVEEVIVSVYGGNTASELNLATSIDDTNALFYNNGCPFIELMLPDYLQFKSQFEMTKAFQDVIHQCINHFHQTISQTPEQLDPRLKEHGFADAHYFLFGASFGGRTAVRHGQFYPGTFNGYISHDGSLTDAKDDMPIVRSKDFLDEEIMGRKRTYDNPQDILPIYHSKDSIDPLLLLHNVDDNNMNVLTSLNFYNALQNKEQARLCLFEKGSSATRIEYQSKGHLLPEDKERYIDVIKHFMKNQMTLIPELTEMTYQMHARVAKKFRHDSHDPLNRFLALANEKLHDNNNRNHYHAFLHNKEEWDAIWKKEYLPLLTAVIDIYHCGESDDLSSGFYERIKFLRQEGLLTDDVIKNALREHAPLVRELYQELGKTKTPSVDDICDDPYIFAIFKEHILSAELMSKWMREFILDNLFFANLPLMQALLKNESTRNQITAQLINDFPEEQIAGALKKKGVLKDSLADQSTEVKDGVKDALLMDLRKSFEDSVLKSSQARRMTWRAAAYLATKQNKTPEVNPEKFNPKHKPKL